MSSLSELIFENVNSEYGWGKYGDFKVLIQRKDGYINATKLCKDGGKDLSTWLRSKTSKNMVDEFKSALQICRELLMETYNGEYELRGTYVHPKLIPHIASWVSPKFAVMVSEIINNYIVREYKEEIYKRDIELGKRKDKIDELLDRTENLEKQNEELIEQTKDLKESNRLLHKKLDLANENIIEAVRGVNQANNNIRGVQIKLDQTADSYVPPAHLQPKDEETYAIFYCDKDEKQALYTQCRARPYHLRRRVAELREKYEDFRVVISFKPVPNARALASEFERRIRERGAAFNQQYQSISLNIGADLTEEGMIELAREVFNERRDPALEAKEEYSTVGLAVDEKGNIQVEEPSLASAHPPEEPENAAPTRDEQFAELAQLRVVELRDIARAFPRDRRFGGWSNKNKSELINWIIQRRGAH